MSWLDIVIIAVFVGSVAWGLWKGAMVQAGSLGGIIFGVVLCRFAGAWGAQLIAGGDAPTYVDHVLAHVGLFIVGWLSVKAVASFFKNMLEAFNLSGLDRAAGALLSLFKWMLVLSLVLNLWAMLKPEGHIAAMSTLGNGHAIRAIMRLAPWLIGGFVP